MQLTLLVLKCGRGLVVIINVAFLIMPPPEMCNFVVAVDDAPPPAVTSFQYGACLDVTARETMEQPVQQ